MHRAPQEIRTFFVTAVCASRRRVFQVQRNAELMLSVLHANREKGRMFIHAFVLMPDHVHLLLTPAPDVSLEKTMQFLKGGYSFLLKSRLEVWQRGFNEQRIVDRGNFLSAVQYIEQNPVRVHLAEAGEDYPYSSAGRAHLVDAMPSWLAPQQDRG